MALDPGTLLNNRYRIIEILGQGGMAAVYRAVDENLGLEVCVKENLFTTDEYARQFRLEATILAGLRQGNLPRVSDHFVIEPQGQYLVMDYIEGEDLRQRVDRLGPLPEQEVIIIGVAICDALAYMHTRKPMILHRDIKPGNVRITPNGHIYLVDFGLAKVVEGRETTNTGARAMTPGYSPPEQYGSARTDPRSDIYSLGATLYSALTDTLPEDGLDRAMNRTELTPIIKHNSKVSENVARIIEISLAVRAEDRYQTAEELRYALMQARSVSKRKLPLELVLQPPPMTIHESLPGEGGKLPSAQSGKNSLHKGDKKNTRPLDPNPDEIDLEPHRSKSGRSTPKWLIVALLSILILSVIALYASRPDYFRPALSLLFPLSITQESTTNPAPSSTNVPIVAVISITPAPTVTKTPTITPTIAPTETSTTTPTSSITPTPQPTALGGADQIAFASTRSGAVEIWIMNIDGSGSKQVTNIPEGACQPRWSPDGTRIAFVSPCVRNLTSYPGASIFIINQDGTNLVPLPSAPGGDYDPAWSPGGEEIAFTSLRGDGVPGIYVINLIDYAVRPLIQDEARAISHPAWSPDGNMIAYVNSDNRVWVMDVKKEERRSLVIGGENFIIHGPSWSPDGSIVIYTRTVFSDTTGSTLLMAVPFTEGVAMPVEVPNSQLVSDVSYSHDGYWILFTSWFSGNHEISIMRANGVDRHLLAPDPAYDFDPVWRPNQPRLP
jgi:eukaryotic-like serine/threonine-protein kinase